MSYSTIYRKEHPEYRETEKEKDRERASKKYNENPEYREHKKKNGVRKIL